MTSVPADFVTDVAELRAQAAQVRFTPVLVTCLVWPFAALCTLIGWTAGSFWYGLVFGALTVRYGFYKGAHLQVVPKAQQPQQPQA